MRRTGWLLAVALLVAACGDSGTPAADLEPGQCFDDPTSTLVSAIDVVDCSGAHDNEAFATVFLTDEVWPGNDGVTDSGYELCLPEFETYTGVSYSASPDLDYGFFVPTQESWEAGERAVYCYLYAADLSKLVGSERAG